MSSITAGTYPESVSSCHPPTPPSSPPPHPAPASAIHGAPLRRRFDIGDGSSGGDPGEEEEEDDDDELFIRAAERDEAKLLAQPCICGRGVCAVEWDEQRGRWVYVCPSQPKCNHVSVCGVGLDPELQLAGRSHPKPSNDCVINISSNHVAEPSTPINNVNLQGSGATTPNIVSPQATISKTPLNSTFQSAGTSTPLHVSPKGPRAAAAVKVSPQRAGSNSKHHICKCTAGKCTVLRKGNEDYYVCHIPKGQGACSYMVPVVAAVNEPTQTETIGDKHLKGNLVENKVYGNDPIQAEDNKAKGLVNPPHPVVAAVNEPTQTETIGDKHLKGNLVENEVYGNDPIQAEDNKAKGLVNPPHPVEKEAHRNNAVEAEDNNTNGSTNPSESDGEWPFEVVDNEIILTAQTTASAEVRQASPSMKFQTSAMAETTTESPMPPYDTITSSPINPRSGNRLSPTGRILEACAELMISCCSGLCAP